MRRKTKLFLLFCEYPLLFIVFIYLSFYQYKSHESGHTRLHLNTNNKKTLYYLALCLQAPVKKKKESTVCRTYETFVREDKNKQAASEGGDAGAAVTGL